MGLRQTSQQSKSDQVICVQYVLLLRRVPSTPGIALKPHRRSPGTALLVLDTYQAYQGPRYVTRLFWATSSVGFSSWHASKETLASCTTLNLACSAAGISVTARTGWRTAEESSVTMKSAPVSHSGGATSFLPRRKWFTTQGPEQSTLQRSALLPRPLPRCPLPPQLRLPQRLPRPLPLRPRPLRPRPLPRRLPQLDSWQLSSGSFHGFLFFFV